MTGVYCKPFMKLAAQVMESARKLWLGDTSACITVDMSSWSRISFAFSNVRSKTDFHTLLEREIEVRYWLLPPQVYGYICCTEFQE